MDSVQSVNNHGTMVMLSPLSGSGKVPLPNGYENGQQIQMGDPFTYKSWEPILEVAEPTHLLVLY